MGYDVAASTQLKSPSMLRNLECSPVTMTTTWPWGGRGWGCIKTTNKLIAYRLLEKECFTAHSLKSRGVGPEIFDSSTPSPVLLLLLLNQLDCRLRVVLVQGRPWCAANPDLQLLKKPGLGGSPACSDHQ